MKMALSLSRDGKHYGAKLVPDHAAFVFATEAAMRRLIADLEKIGAMCKRCNLISRSDELGEDGTCRTGTGCDVDSNRNIFLMTDLFERQTAMAQVANDMWRSYIASMPKDLDEAVHDGPPKDAEEW